MNILVITGDKKFKKGNPRFDMQASAVEKFEVVYWGLDALSPKIPKGEFDVVTAQDPFFRGLIGRFIAHKLSAHLNMQVHADIEKQNVFKYFLAALALPRANSIRVVSEKIKKQVETIGVKAPITVLPIYVNLEPFRALERVPSTQPTILWIGRFEDEKNPLQAITVLTQVQDKGVDVKLIMLGSGSLEGTLRTRAEDLPVEFPGWQSPLEYLPRADVVLSTSRAESWGASIVEALASGVPVMALDVGIAREAGATVVSKEKLADAVIETLRTKPTGELKLEVLSENEWIEKWKETLV